MKTKTHYSPARKPPPSTQSRSPMCGPAMSRRCAPAGHRRRLAVAQMCSSRDARVLLISRELRVCRLAPEGPARCGLPAEDQQSACHEPRGNHIVR